MFKFHLFFKANLSSHPPPRLVMETWVNKVILGLFRSFSTEVLKVESQDHRHHDPGHCQKWTEGPGPSLTE